MPYLLIKELRSERKITQRELARALGVSASTVGMYEQGRRTPPLDMLIRLSDFFALPVDKLINPAARSENMCNKSK